MNYELYYWPRIQGRGEFVRLVLEEVGADYVDVARQPENAGGGIPALMASMENKSIKQPPFAPPYLKVGKQIYSQTANILSYLGAQHNLVPASADVRLWANQLQLVMADFIDEIHNTHHPIGNSLFYEDQLDEAKRYTTHFLQLRLTKYLDYFERIIGLNVQKKGYLIGDRLSYPDLSLFQLVEGLCYAFPKNMARLKNHYIQVFSLRDTIATRPNITEYIASKRRITFNEDGVFRYYPALDQVP